MFDRRHAAPDGRGWCSRSESLETDHPLAFDAPDYEAQTAEDVERMERGGPGAAEFGNDAIDYRKVNEDGSHVILETDSPRHQRPAVPGHKILRIGTLNSILRAVAEVKGLEKEDVLNPR